MCCKSSLSKTGPVFSIPRSICRGACRSCFIYEYICFVYLCIHLCMYSLIYLFILFSVYLYLSIHLSIALFVYLLAYWSICMKSYIYVTGFVLLPSVRKWQAPSHAEPMFPFTKNYASTKLPGKNDKQKFLDVTTLLQSSDVSSLCFCPKKRGDAWTAMRNPKEVMEIHDVGAATVSYQSNLKSKKTQRRGFLQTFQSPFQKVDPSHVAKELFYHQQWSTSCTRKRRKHSTPWHSDESSLPFSKLHLWEDYRLPVFDSVKPRAPSKPQKVMFYHKTQASKCVSNESVGLKCQSCGLRFPAAGYCKGWALKQFLRGKLDRN